MNAQQVGPGRSRRPIRTLLLAVIPLALAGVGGVAAANFAPAPVATPETAPLAMPVDGPVQEVALVTTSDVLDAVVAPAIASDTAAAVPQISISFAPEPEPEPLAYAPTAEGGSGSGASTANSGSPAASAGGSGGGSSSGDSGAAKAAPAPANKPAPQQSSDSYCSAPSSPYSPGGSVKGLLTAANKERARIGVSALSWNGSLASAATGWSQAMAARDAAGNGSALAHNPNRPGGENVAVSGSSSGMSVGAAVNKAHSGWMYSGGHCRNLMNPGYSSMGAGAAANANGTAVYTTANYR